MSSAARGGAVDARPARPARPPRLAQPGELKAHKGIIPPKNPPQSLPPKPDFYDYCTGGVLDDASGCNSKALEAIDQARATEAIGPLEFSLARFLKLSVPEQLFAIADLERVSRGEPPMAALTTQLDQVAKAGATSSGDPSLSARTLSGGAGVLTWGSNWAAGTESALGSDDGWMYDDGPGGFNADCTKTVTSGCWGHRDNILGLYSEDLGSCPGDQRQLMMGAGYAPTSSGFGTSFAEIFIAACGASPTDEVFTWAQAKAAIGIRSARPTEVGIASSPDGKGYFVVNSAGEVSVSGDARRAGGLSGRHVPAPIVAIAVDDANGGYWLVCANGEVYPFGHAPFYGDLRHAHLAHPVVAIAVDRVTGGYWLATSNGAVFSFHAHYHGGASTRELPQPIVAMIADPTARGYWLVGADGRVYPFGKVRRWGAGTGKHFSAPIVAAATTWDGLGYWLAGRDGSCTGSATRRARAARRAST